MIDHDLHGGGGHPWHGLCTDGVLALPNATTRSYPQPSGGDCLRLQVPGHSAPTRSAEQIANDEANGYDWLGYGLLSGDSRAAAGLQLYGTALGPLRWIWAISSSEKWLVDASALAIDAGTVSGNLLLTEFGMTYRDGTAAATHSVAVSLAIGGNGAATIMAPLAMRIMDTSLAGDRGTLAVYAYADDTTDPADPMRPLPIAAIRVTLTMTEGVPAAVLAKVYNGDNIAPAGRSCLYNRISTIYPLMQLSAPVVVPVANSQTRLAKLVSTNVVSGVQYVHATLGLKYAYGKVGGGDIPPGSTDEFVLPFVATVQLDGQDVPRCATGPEVILYDFSATVTTMADITAERDAALAALAAGPSLPPEVSTGLTNIETLCGGPGAVMLLENIYWIDVNDSFVTNITYTSVLSETVVGTGDLQVKFSTYSLFIEYDVGLIAEVDGEGCVVSIAPGYEHRSHPAGGTESVYWFKKHTEAASGAVSYQVWHEHPYCAGGLDEPQWLSAPELNETIAPADPVPIWLTVSAVIDDVDTDLGTLYFNITVGTIPAATWLINDASEGAGPYVSANHDRYVMYLPDLDIVAAELVFMNPCAHVMGLAIHNLVPGTTLQEWYLHELVAAVPTLTAQAWAGWSATGPYDYGVTHHPVTGEIAYAAGAAACFV